MERQNMWIIESQRLPMASYYICAAPLTQHGAFVAVGWNLCHSYSPRHRRWQALPPMTEKWRYACSVVPLGNEIVVLGGPNGTLSSLSSVERLKLDDEGQPLGSWEAAPGMTQARAQCAAVVAEGNIVVVGGHDFQLRSSLSSAEMFDPLKNTWERLPDMAAERHGCAAVAIGDKIYVFGGEDRSSRHNSAECYCINTKQWHSLPPMRKRRSFPAAVAIGGRILVLGGEDEERRNLSDVEVFDTSTMRWEEDHDVPNLNTGRWEHGATTVGNRIYVVGGWGDAGRLDTMEILEVQAPHLSQPDLKTEIAKRDAEIANLRTQIAQKRVKTDLEAQIVERDAEIAKLNAENTKLNAENAKLRTQIARGNPGYSEFETRIDVEAEVATLNKQIQDYSDSFELDAISLAVQAKRRLLRLEELLKTMPTAQQLRADISDLEERIRGLRNENRLKDAIPLARKHEELVEQLRKEEMAEGQKTLPRPLFDTPR